MSHSMTFSFFFKSIWHCLFENWLHLIPKGKNKKSTGKYFVVSLWTMTNQTPQKVAHVFFIESSLGFLPKSLPEILTFIFSKSACHAMRRFLGFLSKDCLSETTLCSAGGNHFPPQSFVLLTGRAAGAKWWHEHNVSPDSCREISRWFTGKSVEKWRHFNLMEILIDLIIYWIFIKALFLKMIKWSVYVCVLKRLLARTSRRSFWSEMRPHSSLAFWISSLPPTFLPPNNALVILWWVLFGGSTVGKFCFEVFGPTDLFISRASFSVFLPGNESKALVNAPVQKHSPAGSLMTRWYVGVQNESRQNHETAKCPLTGKLPHLMTRMTRVFFAKNFSTRGSGPW